MFICLFNLISCVSHIFSPDISNYDDDAADFYGDDKAGLNLENWENGGYMDNKNDIDVIDYDLYPYPRGEFRKK